MSSLDNYTNQRKVKKADDKHMLWGVVIVLLAFWGTKLFAKKGPTGTVEVGEGDFGDFGTDGDFDDGEDGSGSGSGDISTKTPNYVPGKTTVPDSGSMYSESVKETMPYAQNGSSGCYPNCIK